LELAAIVHALKI
jgi:hypothetical protein